MDDNRSLVTKLPYDLVFNDLVHCKSALYNIRDFVRPYILDDTFAAEISHMIDEALDGDDRYAQWKKDNRQPS